MTSVAELRRSAGDHFLAHEYKLAESSYRQLLALDPHDAGAMVGLARCLRHTSALVSTLACDTWITRALEVDPNHIEARLERAHLAAAHGSQTDAIAAYDAVLRLAPDHPEARYYRDLCAGQTPSRVPARVVADLFDAYAGHYDDHLERDLGYDAPRYLRAAIDAVLAAGSPADGATGRREGQWSVADLGCGTGLAGLHLRDLARTLIGIDLSAKMIERARLRGVYDDLRVGDIVEELARSSEDHDLVVAADVLLYLGDLQPLFGAVAGALRTGGHFAFTVEAGSADRAYLHSSAGRYQHGRSYVDTCGEKAGLFRQHHREFVGRKEHGSEVRSHLFVLAKRSGLRRRVLPD